MKIKNLAFYGVMAAILGSVGTARADGAADSTIIASKGYVDAYAQKQSDRVETTWANTSNDIRTSTDKYPSMATLNDAVGSGVTGLDLAQVGQAGKPIVTVSQTDGQVAATVGEITTAGIDSTALATSGTGNNNLGTAGSAVDTKLPTEKAVADALALKEDTSNKLTAAADGATVTPWDASTASDTSYPTVKAVAEQISAANPESIATNALAATGDDVNKLTKASAIKAAATTSVRDSSTAVDTLLPTEKAVATALNGKEDSSNKKNATSAAEWNTLTAAATKSTDYTTVQAVENALSTVTGDYEQNNVVTSANPNKATKVTAVQKGTFYMDGADIANRTANVGINDVNAYVTAALAQGGPGMKWGVEGLTGTEASKMDDYIPTVAAVEARFKAQDRHNNDTYLEGNDITASNVHSIVTYDSDGLVTGGINLNDTLNNINVANGGSTGGNACSAANPCVLSYIGGNTYKWTQMDTEGLNAVADAASGS